MIFFASFQQYVVTISSRFEVKLILTFNQTSNKPVDLYAWLSTCFFFIHNDHLMWRSVNAFEQVWSSTLWVRIMFGIFDHTECLWNVVCNLWLLIFNRFIFLFSSRIWNWKYFVVTNNCYNHNINQWMWKFVTNNYNFIHRKNKKNESNVQIIQLNL